jgi:hypothetical protein
MKRVMILSLLLAFSLVVSAGAAFAEPGDPSDGVDFEALYKPGSRIYLGAYDHAASKDAVEGKNAEEERSEHQNYTADRVHYEGERTPVLWRVMGEENGKIVLMTEYVIDFWRFDRNTNEWGQSNHQGIRRWLDDEWYHDGFLSHAKRTFNDVELDLVERSNDVKTSLYLPNSNNVLVPSGDLYNRFGGSPNPIGEGGVALATAFTSDDFYLLCGTYSFPEAGANIVNSNKVSWWADDVEALSKGQVSCDLGEGNKKAATLKNREPADYWLRSPSPYDDNPGNLGDKEKVLIDNALYVEGISGNVMHSGVSTFRGVRPVLKFRQERGSVLFVSKDIGGQSPGENHKLTLLNKDLFAMGMKIKGEELYPGKDVRVQSGDLVSVLAAQVSPGTLLTYKLVDSGGSIVSSNQGERMHVQIDTNGLTPGAYRAYVWAQKNEQLHSHEGSEPLYFNLLVSGGGAEGGAEGGEPVIPVTPITSGDTASGIVTSSDLNELIERAIAEDKPLILNVGGVLSEDVTIVSVSVSVENENLEKFEKDLIITTPRGDIALNPAARRFLTNRASQNGENKIEVVISRSGKNNGEGLASPLNDDQKKALSDYAGKLRWVFDLQISAGGGPISTDLGTGGTIAVGLAGDLKPDDEPGDINAYYIDEEGKGTRKTCRYVDDRFTFNTAHLSIYALVSDKAGSGGSGGGGGCDAGLAVSAFLVLAVLTTTFALKRR